MASSGRRLTPAEKRRRRQLVETAAVAIAVLVALYLSYLAMQK
ncbi:hypothetical protein [Nocardioides aquiterrae]|uniref:Uncharacterized protein n=1 Tax=Nocardioides aquiterrae TaxID=203799 RepID=A0ABN1UE07_9ACTN